MIQFVDWIDMGKFVVREGWDFESGSMKSNIPLQLFPFEKRILGKSLHVREDGTIEFSTVVFSTIKKTGKSTVAAAVVAWFADQAPDGTEIYIVANDLEQAEGRVMRDVKFNYRQLGIPVNKYNVELPNGTIIQALAKEYKSAAGSRHSLTVWDELWGYESEASRRMWSELTPIPTVKNSFRFISTYAGFENESELLWDLYLSGVGQDEHKDGRGVPVEGLEDLPCWTNGRLFTFWDHEPRMPWQTQEYYDDQLAQLRPSDFIRLHRNQWVTSHEQFIPVEWWDTAAEKFEQSAEFWDKHPYRYWPVSIGVDVGVKHDCTAVVGTTYDPGRGKVIQLFHKIWTPREDEIFDLEATVEAYLLWAYGKYNVSSIVYDPAHFHRSMTTLVKKALPMFEFKQTVDNMTSASQQLFDLLRTKNYETYPDVELRSHIQMAVAESKGRGFRIVKGKEKKTSHIDGAIAAAMSAYDAIRQGGTEGTQEQKIESPFGDIAVWDHEAAEAKLPWPFRE